MARLRAHDPSSPGGLVGATAVAEEPLEPRGWVRVGPELWRAELVDGAVAAPRGMAPFGVSAEYKKKHPQGKVPLLEVDGRPLPDSSAIFFYLERIQPQPALYPSEPFDQARAIWLEEFADGALMPAFAPFFQQRVLGPLFFKRPGDEALVDKAAKETIPPLFDYLEAQLAGNDYLVGNRFTIADLSVGSMFVNYQHGKGEIEVKRWPAVAAYVERVHARPSFKGLIEEDRSALAQLGGKA